MTREKNPNERKPDDDQRRGIDLSPRPGIGKQTGKQREGDIQRADRGMTVTADDETLIEMRAMRLQNIFAAERTLPKREARIKDERPDEECAEHERVAAFAGRDQRQDCKRITEKRAGNVAHENFRR